MAGSEVVKGGLRCLRTFGLDTPPVVRTNQLFNCFSLFRKIKDVVSLSFDSVLHFMIV
jgi:hypothetical protein